MCVLRTPEERFTALPEFRYEAIAPDLVGRDWGGLIGLRLVAEHPDRFGRVVAANTGMPTGDLGMPDLWWQFRRTVESAEHLEISRLVQSGCLAQLPDPVRAAYDAPFPDENLKAGPRAMSALVPTRPDDPATPANRAGWDVLKCGTSRSSWRSRTPTQSPARWRRSCGRPWRAPQAATTRRWSGPATAGAERILARAGPGRGGPRPHAMSR